MRHDKKVESPSTMVDGIGNVIVARRLRSVLLLLLVAVVVATDGRLDCQETCLYRAVFSMELEKM